MSGFFSDWGDFKSKDALGLGLGAAGGIAGILESKKRQKKAAALRKSMLEAADAGASSARSRIASAAGKASGAATQSSIDRGFYNSTADSDAQSSITQNAALDMGDVDQRVAQQKAGIMADTFDPGGVDLSGIGQTVGMLLARRNRGGQGGEPTPGSAVSQDSQKAPAVLTPGGDPNLNSTTFDKQVSGMPMETATQPTTVATAVGAALRRRRAGFPGYGLPSFA